MKEPFSDDIPDFPPWPFILVQCITSRRIFKDFVALPEVQKKNLKTDSSSARSSARFMFFSFAHLQWQSSRLWSYFGSVHEHRNTFYWCKSINLVSRSSSPFYQTQLTIFPPKRSCRPDRSVPIHLLWVHEQKCAKDSVRQVRYNLDIFRNVVPEAHWHENRSPTKTRRDTLQRFYFNEWKWQINNQTWHWNRMMKAANQNWRMMLPDERLWSVHAWSDAQNVSDLHHAGQHLPAHQDANTQTITAL